MSIAIPKPPRLTGNQQNDTVAIITWAWDFYKAVEIQGAYAKSADVASDIANAVDPANATAGTAQETANTALALAGNLEAGLDAGTVTISDAATTGAVTFTTEQADASYIVTASVSSVTGTPAANAYTLAGISGKATTGFTVSLRAAPGAGTSITYAWQLQRPRT